MKRNIAIATAFAMIIIPAGFALAKEKDNGKPEQPRGIRIFQHLESNLEFMLGRHDGDSDDDISISASTSASTSVGVKDRGDEHRSATSTERNKGKRGDEERGGHASSSTSTTKERPEWGAHGGLPGFFRWLFGLPASTTVGEIRAQIEASTTASTTNGTSSGLGFFAKLFSFFHF